MEQNFKLEEVVLDEDGCPIDTVLLAKNLARTKGFLVGASLVGAGWLGTILYKKFKRCKINKTVDPQEDHEND